MALTLQQLAFAAEHLQRDGEAQAYADSVEPRAAFDRHRDQSNGAAYEAFLERRFEVFLDLPPRFDGVAIGWHRAAVRLFGERAEEALSAAIVEFGDDLGWPGAGVAERSLVAAMDRRNGRSDQ